MEKEFKIFWADEAVKQLDELKKSKIENLDSYLSKIIELLESIKKDPFKGLGKPEPLKEYYPKSWSRRINKKDRLIYKVEKDKVFIISIIGHYD
ncbi:yoeb toxin protein [hydrocarbon metagenome]|uniref:Putative mRNA interferase YoeB n=1 Tax=hydrocarbon metagenome TaxID=938273 RepID=A0A0W8G1M0_9ZZZZ